MESGDDNVESLILEEEIDENYEPTEKEIQEYAVFLGMDIEDDQEYFYIAKEGLKAPLPPPWKPRQNKNGEIYYYNSETRQSTWEHPCDQYYKGLFQKEKAKGLQKLSQKHQTKHLKKNFPSAAYGNKPGIKENDSLLAGSGVFDKRNDPLLKVEYEKKLKLYQQKKDEELEQKRREIDNLYEQQMRDLEDNHAKLVKNIEKQYKEKRLEEEKQLRLELENLKSTAGMEKELEKYEGELKKELEKTNKTRLQAEKREYEQKQRNYVENLKSKNREVLRQKKEEMRKKYERELNELKEEEQRLGNDADFDNFREEEELDRMKREYMKEMEEKFREDKDRITRSIHLESKDMMARELEKHNKKLDELFNANHKEKTKDSSFNEEEYRKILEQEFERKVADLKNEYSKKIELSKLMHLSKVREYELQRKEDIKKKLERELEEQNRILDREREKLESDFLLEKTKIEQKALEEFVQYKKKIQEEALNASNDLKLSSSNQANLLRFEHELSKLNRDYEEKLKEFELLKRQMEELNLEDNVDDSSDHHVMDPGLRAKERFLMENDGNILDNGSELEDGPHFLKKKEKNVQPDTQKLLDKKAELVNNLSIIKKDLNNFAIDKEKRNFNENMKKMLENKLRKIEKKLAETN